MHNNKFQNHVLTVIKQILIANFEEQMGKVINVLTYKSEKIFMEENSKFLWVLLNLDYYSPWTLFHCPFFIFEFDNFVLFSTRGLEEIWIPLKHSDGSALLTSVIGCHIQVQCTVGNQT